MGICPTRLIIDIARTGANPNRGLATAATSEHEAIVELLLEKGVDFDEGVPGAAWNVNDALVERLLERGADNDELLLTYVATGGKRAMARLLLEDGPDHSEEAVRKAMQRANEEILVALLEKFAEQG